MVEDFEECDAASDLACPSLCSTHCACPSMGSGPLELHAIDVGQGDSLLVISPAGFTLLMDAGTHSQSATVEAYMTSIGVSELDYAVVSHLDADQVGGMDGVVNNHPELVASFDHGGSGSTQEASDYEAAAGSRRATLSRGELTDVGAGMTIGVVHSDAGASTENNRSVVLRLDYGDTCTAESPAIAAAVGTAAARARAKTAAPARWTAADGLHRNTNDDAGIGRHLCTDEDVVPGQLRDTGEAGQ